MLSTLYEVTVTKCLLKASDKRGGHGSRYLTKYYGTLIFFLSCPVLPLNIPSHTSHLLLYGPEDSDIIQCK